MRVKFRATFFELSRGLPAVGSSDDGHWGGSSSIATGGGRQGEVDTGFDLLEVALVVLLTKMGAGGVNGC